MDENTAKYGAKKFAIGVNTGRKLERERQADASRKAFNAGRRAGQKKERKRQAANQRYKKWYRYAITAAATTVLAVEGIDLLIAQLVR
jgi:hypothetical protein